jgi:hypothetical protein
VFGVGDVLVLGGVILVDVAVMLGVQLAGFHGVMGRVSGVAGGDLGVVSGHFDFAFGVQLCRFAVVARRMVVMIGGVGVVIVDSVFGRHPGVLSESGRGIGATRLRRGNPRPVIAEGLRRFGEFFV